MVAGVIRWSARNVFLVGLASVFVALAGVKIGLPREYFGDGSAPDVLKAVHAALAECRKLGAETVEQRLRQSPMEPSTAIAIAIQVCHAVSAVHKAGLLHRDIKAQNVMLAKDGRAVLMDFGTVREVAVVIGALLGTIFLKGTLEKLGIEFDGTRHGKYKSAIETFTEDSLTPPNREQFEAYLDAPYGEFLTAAAQGRHVSRESMEALSSEQMAMQVDQKWTPALMGAAPLLGHFP